MRFEVHMAMSMLVFPVVMPCGLAGRLRMEAVGYIQTASQSRTPPFTDFFVSSLKTITAKLISYTYKL
jgi:hypothetical protein